MVTLPYQNHQKLRKEQSTSEILSSNNSLDLSIFLGKPFWIWDKEKHKQEFIKTNGDCCFNHFVGLPIKNDKQYPLFPYEKLVFDAIESNQNIWVLKSRGIGLTTLLIRYLAWKILSSNELDDKSIFIISGTREQFANYIKEKLEQLFVKKFSYLKLDSKYTELWLKKTWIKVFPTTAVKDLRGYFEASYIFIDESDFFPDSVQEELIHAITPYQEKSNCKIIMVSTPNRPDGLMQRIENDPNSKYTKLKLDYTYGLDLIYDRAFIEKKKQEPEFPREYECQYLETIGNVFSPLQIDAAIKSGNELIQKDIPISQYTLKCVGVDVGFSSSKTAIVLTEHLKDQDKIIVRYSEEFDKGDPNAICDLLFNFHRQYWNLYILIDGSNRAMVNLLKIKFNEPLDWDTKDVSPDTMRVLPVNFSTDHKSMLSHLHLMVSKGYLAIPEKHDKLITSLRTAYAKELTLDKDQTSYDDSLDALRLSLKGYKIN